VNAASDSPAAQSATALNTSAGAASGMESALGELLQGLQQRLRRRYLAHGLAFCALVPAVVIAVAFGLDHSLRLPLPIRLFHTLLLGVLLAAAVVRYLSYPLQRRFAATDLAALVEQRFPALQQRLVSAVQFGGEASAETRNQSPAMMAAVRAEALQLAKDLPLEALFDPRRTRRIGMAAAAVTALLATGAAISPAAAGAFFWRHLGIAADYPRETHLQLEVPPAGPELQRVDRDDLIELVMPAGGDLHVAVLAEGIVPAEVRLHVTSLRSDGDEAEGGTRTVLMAPRPGDRFRHVFRRVSGSFRFHASGGDDDRGDRTVVVRTLHPPQVEGLRHTITPPAYTGQPTTQHDGGAIEALLGSEVQIQVQTTLAVRTATLVMLEGGERQPLTAVELQDDGGTATAFRGKFRITVSDRYQIELLGDQGLRNPNPGTYPILAQQDYAPVGRWLLPDEESTLLLPTALLCLRTELRDDFGIAEVELVVEHAGGVAMRRTPTLRPAANAEGPGFVTQTVLTDWLEVRDLLTGSKSQHEGLAIAMTLRDNRAPTANATELPRRIVQVVEQTQLAEHLAKLFRNLREETQQAFDIQQDRRNRLETLAVDLKASSAEFAPILASIEVGQSRVQGSSERLHRGLMRAFDHHLWNRLETSPNAGQVVELYQRHSQGLTQPLSYDPEFYRDLNRRRTAGTLGAMETTLDPILQMIAIADRLANEDAPKAARLLAAAQVARAGGELERMLAETLAMQDRIQQALQALLLRLADWHDFQDLIQEARALRDRQLDLQSRTEEVQGRK